MTYTYAPSEAGSRRNPSRAARECLSSVEKAALSIIAVALVIAAVGVLSPSTEVALSPVKVREGQTLWQLAQTHPIDGLTTAQTVELIAEENGLSGGALQAGATLLLPTETSRNTVAMR